MSRPLKILAGDKRFYGELQPQGTPLTNSTYTGSNKQPPNPTTPKVLYRTKEAQEIARERMNTALQDPEPVIPETKDPVKDQQMQNTEGKEDVADFVEKEKSLGQRFTDFLRGDLVETTQEQKVLQSKRELARIGVSDEPVENKIEGETAQVLQKKIDEGLDAPRRAVNYVGQEIQNVGQQISSNLTQLFLIGAGLYLLSSFLQNPALLDRRTTRKYTKKSD